MTFGFVDRLQCSIIDQVRNSGAKARHTDYTVKVTGEMSQITSTGLNDSPKLKLSLEKKNQNLEVII